MKMSLPKNRQIDLYIYILVNDENKICGNNKRIKRN